MPNNNNQLILVNEQDEWLGSMEKLEAHRKGLLHRAFSVFILNDKGELLLQRRAAGKYHSGGLWTNTCCSHPRPGESTQAAAHRRLQEEMGFDTDLQPLFHLRYRAEVGNNLIENEYDHVYMGYFNGTVLLDAEEASDYRFVPLAALQEWISCEPQEFTPWLKLAMPDFLKHIQAEA